MEKEKETLDSLKFELETVVQELGLRETLVRLSLMNRTFFTGH